MNISGPLPVSGVNISPQQELDLRPFQRVTAQILSVTGTTALLTIDGYPIVAQLASADQAATLIPQQTKQFIVTQRTNEKITLKVFNNDQLPTNPSQSVPPAQELAVRLLEQQNIPVTANHLIIARAILKKHLPIAHFLLDEISETLSAYGSWSSREAELAVAIKSAGLPLSPESLALASRQAGQLGDSLARLISKLMDTNGQEVPEDLLKQLHSNLQILNTMIVKADSESSELAEQLKAIIDILGKSLERVVLEQIQNSESLSESRLLTLVRLQQQLEQAGKSEMANAISDFLKDLQWHQYLNTGPEANSGPSKWSEIGFTIRSAQKTSGDVFSSGRLRIAREPRDNSGKINPAYTRLILQVDLNPGQTVEVDLSVVAKQVRAGVTAPDARWCQGAQEELPTLEQAFQSLGFTLKDTRIKVGKPDPFEQLIISRGSPLMTVDIEA